MTLSKLKNLGMEGFNLYNASESALSKIIESIKGTSSSPNSQTLSIKLLNEIIYGLIKRMVGCFNFYIHQRIGEPFEYIFKEWEFY